MPAVNVQKADINFDGEIFKISEINRIISAGVKFVFLRLSRSHKSPSVVVLQTILRHTQILELDRKIMPADILGLIVNRIKLKRILSLFIEDCYPFSRVVRVLERNMQRKADLIRIECNRVIAVFVEII